MSNASDFIIENGVLKKYVGPGGDVVIPAEVERIGSMAFYDHKTLTSIIIPDHVKELGERVFKGCTHLQTVTIPDTAKIIGKPSLLGHLFSGCVALEAVNTSPEKKNWRKWTKKRPWACSPGTRTRWAPWVRA